MAETNNHEGRIARLEQRGDDFSRRLLEVAPLGNLVVMLTERVENLRSDLHGYNHDLTSEISKRTEREKEMASQQIAGRRALYVIGVMIFCALVGAVAVVVAGGHP